MHNTLQNLRISEGLSKQQLAKCLNVSVETVSSLENGLLIKIASFFNITIESLVTGYRLTKDQIELLKNYNSLSDVSKGMLLERALCLVEESLKKTG